MYRRYMARAVLDALSDTPVTLVDGARQTGKTTLVRELIAHHHPARYLTLDDPGVLSAARTDPAGFIAALSGPVAIDEIQRAPELFTAIKAAVDQDRTPGRFVLTGSANSMLLPRLSDSLAGRMQRCTLWPLAQCEISGGDGRAVDILYSEQPLPLSLPAVDRTVLARAVTQGGYPEAVSRPSAARRAAWFRGYLETLLSRDVRDLANIQGLMEVPRLTSLLAARNTGVLNQAGLSRDTGLPHTTLARYLVLLQAVQLVQLVPAWLRNTGQRLIKSPKSLLVDTGLVSYLVGETEERLMRLGNPSSQWGALLEGFVLMEFVKLAGWSESAPALFHFRTTAGAEVDLVLEDRLGRLVGVEVKASATIRPSDFSGLRALAQAGGSSFHRGVVLYPGSETLPFGERLFALPLSVLWA